MALLTNLTKDDVIKEFTSLAKGAGIMFGIAMMTAGPNEEDRDASAKRLDKTHEEMAKALFEKIFENKAE